MGELRAWLSRQDDCPSTFLTRVAERVTLRGTLGDESLVSRVYRRIYQLSTTLLNANGIGDFPPMSWRYRSRCDECKSDRQIYVIRAIDHV